MQDDIVKEGATRLQQDVSVMRGIIVKGIGGFYYVDTGSGVVECRARGLFRKDKIKPCVGDEVDVETGVHTDEAVITRIHERRNHFLRPPVSNVDQFVIVTALADPAPNFTVLDRFILAAESESVDVVLCFTKKDLTGFKTMKMVREVYGKLYPHLFTDARDPASVSKLIPMLGGKKSALAGPSGAGKSTILRTLRQGDGSIRTGTVSEKTGRGRHTTRHVEIFGMDFGGMVFDTPGFTSFDLSPDISETTLQELYPEFVGRREACRFSGCLHIHEPDCAVREAVEKGYIHPLRYESYRSELERIQKDKAY